MFLALCLSLTVKLGIITLFLKRASLPYPGQHRLCLCFRLDGKSQVERGDAHVLIQREIVDVIREFDSYKIEKHRKAA